MLPLAFSSLKPLMGFFGERISVWITKTSETAALRVKN
jgi:hypothetical protein